MIRGLRRDTRAHDPDTRHCTRASQRSIDDPELLCALSQPAGLVGGLPVGLQIIGRPWAERTVLALGQAFEAVKQFHAWRPKVSALGLE
jgi:Asp-tRNA(Asn)/Glu-tRNA(Gln) amidotransferase A subunit family amidase